MDKFLKTFHVEGKQHYIRSSLKDSAKDVSASRKLSFSENGMGWRQAFYCKGNDVHAEILGVCQFR